MRARAADDAFVIRVFGWRNLLLQSATVTPYTLREATVVDSALLARNRARMFEEMAVLAGKPIRIELLQRVEADSARLFAETLGQSQFGWIAEVNGAPACTGMLVIQDWLPHPLYPTAKRAYFHSMYTEPAQRGHGMAKAITERAIAWCRTHGFDALVLHASEQGRPMYEKMGFTHANEWRIAV